MIRAEVFTKPLTPHVWTKAVCRTLGICSERVDVRNTDKLTRTKSYFVASIYIDGTHLGVFLKNFTQTHPDKSTFELVDTIFEEVCNIEAGK